MQSVLTVQSLDIESTLITNPKLNKNKQLTAGIINEKTRSALYIETPFLINPFGVTTYDGGKTIQEEAKTWSLVLKADAGKQYENTEEINKLFKFLKELDEKTIDFGILHSQTIFKKKYDESQRSILLDLLYNRGVKPSIGADGTVYPDKITLKIMKTNDMLPDVVVYKDSPIPLEITSWENLQSIVPKGTPIKAIMQPRLYFVNGKFGINFRVLQIKLPNYEKIGRPTTYAFSDPPALKNADTVKTETNVKSTSQNEEEEDDEEEDSEVEVEDN